MKVVIISAICCCVTHLIGATLKLVIRDSLALYLQCIHAEFWLLLVHPTCEVLHVFDCAAMHDSWIGNIFHKHGILASSQAAPVAIH